MRKMLQNWLQCLFIFIICTIFLVSCGLLQENRTAEEERLFDIEPRVICESMFCSCADFVKLGNVTCLGSDGNNIRELAFYETKGDFHLCKKMFLGLNIHSLTLNVSKITVDEKFLEGIVALSVFNVEHSDILGIPSFRIENNSIEVIRIQSSRLRSLEGKNLQNLTSLKYLSVKRNYIMFIDPDVFKGTENLEELDISYNLLKSIPRKLLDPMKKLKQFIADHNQLLHVDNLFSITLPAVIKLDFNNITNANSYLFFKMQKDLRQFDVVENSHYYDVCNVRFLDLSYNFIKELHHSFISYCGNKRNGLPTYSFINLKLEGNELQYLAEEDFRFVNKAEKLDLKKNHIRWIDSHTFKNVRYYLSSLDLSSNNITFINGSIRYMYKLYYLSLAFNSIQTFADDEFVGLQNLQHLYLQQNQIKNLEPLYFLPSVHSLFIGNNDIKLIRPEKLPKALLYISFKGNPFNCDCHLQKFLGWLKENPLVRTDTSEQYWCMQPGVNRIEKLKDCPDSCSCRCTDIKDDHLMFVDCSSKNLSVVPEIFRNDATQMNDNETYSSDDWRLFQQDKKHYPTFLIEDNISGLSLENNRLEFLNEAKLPPNLTHLYLSNNNLRWLPEDIFENQLNLKEVSLSGNPWNCDCSALNFKNWLTSKHHIIRDIDNVLCGISDKGKTNLTGRVIWKLYDFDLCPTTNFGLIVLYALSSLISAFF